MIPDLGDLVTAAVDSFFGTMLSMQMLPVPMSAPPQEEDVQIAGSVGFVGPLSGIIYSHLSEAFARRITCDLLGMDDFQVTGGEMINDTVGEMSNMLVGHIKSRLCDRGLPCVLTLPSIVRGRGLSVAAPSTTQRHFFGFASEGFRLFIEVHLKRDESYRASS